MPVCAKCGTRVTSLRAGRYCGRCWNAMESKLTSPPSSPFGSVTHRGGRWGLYAPAGNKKQAQSHATRARGKWKCNVRVKKIDGTWWVLAKSRKSRRK